jgi:hypothetical protein
MSGGLLIPTFSSVDRGEGPDFSVEQRSMPMPLTPLVFRSSLFILPIFWTSSPNAGSSGYAWYVYFHSGRGLWDLVGNYYRVRCVR